MIFQNFKMSLAMVALKTGETMAETEMVVAAATKATTQEGEADTSQEVAVATAIEAVA